MSKTENMNRVKIYPVPAGAVLQEDYCLRVRPVGTDAWQELKTYRVKVNMHDVRSASMAYFDFSGRVEVEINKDRFHNLHLFAGDLDRAVAEAPDKNGANVMVAAAGTTMGTAGTLSCGIWRCGRM